LRLHAALLCLVLGCGAEDTTPPPDYPPGPYGAGAGETLANLRFTDCAGRPVELRDFYRRARVLWLAIQAGWCPSCGPERQLLQQLHAEHAEQGLVVLLVLGENAIPDSGEVGDDYCASFAEHHALTFPVLQDPGFAVTAPYTRNGVPRQILLDGDFRQLTYEMGWEPWMEARYRDLIEPRLGVKRSPRRTPGGASSGR